MSTLRADFGPPKGEDSTGPRRGPFGRNFERARVASPASARVIPRFAGWARKGDIEMTETIEAAAVTEALGLIDAQLGIMHAREIVSATDVSDLLLDLRQLLTPTSAPEPEPATA